MGRAADGLAPGSTLVDGDAANGAAGAAAEPERVATKEELELEDMYLDLANESVDAVIKSVCGLVRKGEVKVHGPKLGWDDNKFTGDKGQLIHRQKRYNRITRLLNKASLGDLDAQKELETMKIQLKHDAFAEGTPEDVLVMDMQLLLQAKNKREEDARRRRVEKERLEQAKEVQRRRAEAKYLAMVASDNKRKEWESELMEKIREDKIAAREARLQQKEQAKKEEEKRAKQAEERMKQIRPSTPMFEKLQKRYDNEVLLPELEERKRVLKEKTDVFKRNTNADIRAHQAKLSALEPHQPRKVQADQEIKVYRSKALHESVAKNMNPEKQRQEAIRLAKQKQKEYQASIAKKFKPKIDTKLAEKLKRERMKLEENKKKIREMRKRGKLAEAQKHDNLKAGLKNVIGDDPNKIGQQRKRPPTPPKPKSHTNYLTELHAQRKENPAAKPSRAGRNKQAAARDNDEELLDAAKKRMETLRNQEDSTDYED